MKRGVDKSKVQQVRPPGGPSAGALLCLVCTPWLWHVVARTCLSGRA